MHIELERHPPLVIADVADIFECRLMRRVVYENIYAAQYIDRSLDDCTTLISVSKIAGHEKHFSVLFLDQRLDLASILVLVKVGMSQKFRKTALAPVGKL